MFVSPVLEAPLQVTVKEPANRAYGRVGLPFRQAKRIKIRKKIQNLTLFQDYFLVFLRHSIPYI